MGSNLIALALLIITLGIFSVFVFNSVEVYTEMEKHTLTNEHNTKIRNALIDFKSKNGRLPCPAPLNADIDAPGFGVEITPCTADIPELIVKKGHNRTNITEGAVATGAVPIRTLQLHDSIGFDGWKKRIMYSVSSGYTATDLTTINSKPEINIVDQNNHLSTSEEGNVIFTLTAFRDIDSGAYSQQGKEIMPCVAGSKMEEVCDFDSEFLYNNVYNTDNPDENNNVKLAYHTEKLVNCVPGTPPKSAGFLLDNSTSMSSKARCPDGQTGECTRMDGAMWAMRRVLAARLHSIGTDTGYMTGFTAFTAEREDPDIALTEIQSSFEVTDQLSVTERLNQTCSDSPNTPLGVYMDAVSKLIDDGEAGLPNVITIISDGQNNGPITPTEVIDNIIATSPNTIVNIIDVGREFFNPLRDEHVPYDYKEEMKRLAESTGGNFFETSNASELLEYVLLPSVGLCRNTPMPPFVDEEYCQP